MIGNDCKILEDNIDTFIYVFVRKNEEWQSESCLKLRQVYGLYKAFADLARYVLLCLQLFVWNHNLKLPKYLRENNSAEIYSAGFVKF